MIALRTFLDTRITHQVGWSLNSSAPSSQNISGLISGMVAGMVAVMVAVRSALCIVASSTCLESGSKKRGSVFALLIVIEMRLCLKAVVLKFG